MSLVGGDFHQSILGAQEAAIIVFEAVRDAAGDIVDIRVVYRNESAVKISGHHAQVPIGECVRATMKDDVGERMYLFNKGILETGEPQERTLSFGHLGSDRIFVVHGKKHGDYVISSYRDVTEKARADKTLEEFARRLDIATDAAGIGVWELDIEKRVHRWDARTCEIHGLPAEPTEFALEDAAPLVHPEDWRALKAQAEVDLAQPVFSSRHRVLRPGGTDGWVQIYGRLVVDSDGRRTVGVCWDVTDEVDAAEELTRKNAEAEAASQAKSRFLASMSHEIRTPMNGVLGMAQALAMTDVSDKQKSMVDVILRSGEALLSLLNDILDLSRIEAGGMTIDIEEFDLGRLARDVGALFSAKAENAGLTFEIVVEPEADGVFEGDELRIRQILNNLVSNAIKFTEAGEVGVRVSVDPATREVVIAVRDTGVGIEPEQIASVFDAFVQVDDSSTRRFGGSGLGLSIVQRLAEAMGGGVSATSMPGEGSTFTARLPLQWAGGPQEACAAAAPAAPATPAAERPKEEAAGRRVLVAEDNAGNQAVFETVLSAAGFACVIAETGIDALAEWEKGGFDAVIMDIAMPVMDGIETTIAIRARERETGRTRIPILAVTANVMPGQVALYRATGMDGWIAKPIDNDKLVGALKDILEPAQPDARLG